MATGHHVEGRIQAFLDGSLSAEEAAQAAAHLSQCASCGMERDLVAEARAVLKPLSQGEPRAGFAARVALAARDERLSLIHI